MGTLANDIIGCRACPRLVAYAAEVRESGRKPGFARDDYWCRPVPSFGGRDAWLLIVGLAPGTHGAGRTGRPFTGDYAGDLLYRALWEQEWSSGPESRSRDDPLALDGVRIANALRCAPPQNKPTGDELKHCRPFLERELALLPQLETVLALGGVAHRQVITTVGGRQVDHKFGHGARHALPGVEWELVDSYHPSRYNLNTRRLTAEQFTEVLSSLRD
ncbi:MAG: uracil-DNA glycosylase [Candidatus Poseidoniia archaeon]|jgi:uracil-DNA glycosylase family 4|nr:uracil-DNA glycosylase [Candidatus Poseidoniia archaeon]